MVGVPLSAVEEHTLLGRVELRRVGRWRFPVHHLVQDSTVLATLGRMGWLRVFFGWGVRVDLSDGTRWRIRATTIAGFVCPVVVDADRRKVALARGGTGIYGLSGRDFGYTLNPGHRPWGAASTWTLRSHEDDVGTVSRRPLAIEAREPMHLGAVLLSFVLIKYGVPDDARTGLPALRWG